MSPQFSKCTNLCKYILHNTVRASVLHAHTHVHTHKHTCTHTNTHAHTQTHMHTHKHTCTHIHIFISSYPCGNVQDITGDVVGTRLHVHSSVHTIWSYIQLYNLLLLAIKLIILTLLPFFPLIRGKGGGGVSSLQIPTPFIDPCLSLQIPSMTLLSPSRSPK